MDGIIVINKSYGATSHQAVQAVRRLFPGVKAGHSGTLDPIATGVLPVCLGRATRIVEYIIEHPKVYRAAVTLGKTTDTDDSAGKVTATRSVPGLEKSRVESLLAGFQGSIEQLPPRYSAVKYRGKPLYSWARKGKDVPRKTRRAEIYRIELLQFNPDREPQLIFDVECSKGTYIRTLAVDIGNALGCGGHLDSLARLAVGPFVLEHSHSLPEIETLGRHEQYRDLIRPMDSALAMLPALSLNDALVGALKNGQVIRFDSNEIQKQTDLGERKDKDRDKVRVYDQQGNFKAIARLEQSGAEARLKTLKYLSS